jgi:hypothetical protein
MSPRSGLGAMPDAGAAQRAPGRQELSAPPPYLYDPRPDLTADSRDWQALLELAFLLDGEEADGLFGALHGVRCCGAQLVSAAGARSGPGGHRIVPGDDYLGGARAWAADRECWLVPAADVLAPMLRGLRPGVDGCAPGGETPPVGRPDRRNEARHQAGGGRS